MPCLVLDPTGVRTVLMTSMSSGNRLRVLGGQLESPAFKPRYPSESGWSLRRSEALEGLWLPSAQFFDTLTKDCWKLDKFQSPCQTVAWVGEATRTRNGLSASSDAATHAERRTWGGGGINQSTVKAGGCDAASKSVTV